MSKFLAEKILVSVIVPCYNVEDYIVNCLNSIYNQKYEHLEVICVDNNSNDSTLKILNSYRTRKKNLIVLKEDAKGACAARNTGLKIAKGQWIQFLDADDIILPNKIFHQIKLTLAHKVDFIVASSIIKIEEQAEYVKNPGSDSLIALMNSNFGNTCANLFNKKSLELINNWNEKLDSSQEYDLMFRLIKSNCKFLIDSVPLTIINSRDYGQISKMNPKKTWKQYVLLRIEMLKFIKDSNPEYFFKKQNELFQILFDSIRILYKYDATKSVQLYKKHLKGHVPFKTQSTGFMYIIFFKFFGFQKTEFLRNTFTFKK